MSGLPEQMLMEEYISGFEALRQFFAL